MGEIENAIADFVRAQHRALDPQLPPVAGPRALLRAQLAELAASKVGSRRRFFQFTSATRAAVYVGVAFLVAVLLFRYSTLRESHSAVMAFEGRAVPDRSLTPGATRNVALSDVCSMVHEDVVRDVPTSLRQEVLREYGIANARADDYEIDFLIAPGLGGAEDIHNLWPEPSTSPAWNAHVKDALEENLHEMVCAGQVDLQTAQRDIATDWIAAYKKYFHTDEPLALSSSSARYSKNKQPPQV